MATDWRTRKARRESGWLEVSCLLPPDLVKIMEESRGDQHRSRWLVQQALTLLAPDLVDQVELDRGKGGRPRTRLPTLPDLRVPLRHLTYQPVSLRHYLAGEIKEKPAITLKLDHQGHTVVRFRKYTKFGEIEVYDKARLEHGRWGCHFIPTTGQNEYGVMMPDSRRTDVVVRWVLDNGGEVLDERTGSSGLVQVGVVRSRPLISRTDHEALAWSLEIDIAASRQRSDVRAVHRFLSDSWRWCGDMISWFSVDEAPDLLISSGVTWDGLCRIKHNLAEMAIPVEDEQPWGIADDPVIVEPDDLGLVYRLTANRQDRRCLVLPSEVPVPDWSDYRILMDDLGVVVREQLPAVPDLPDIDWSQVPGWEAPIGNDQRVWQHQKEGVEFVVRNGYRCIIGDEMRCGKTVQAITAVNVRGCRRILAVVPSTAQAGWRTMIRQWAVPGQEPHVIILDSTTEVPDLPQDSDCPVWIISTYAKLTPAGLNIPLGGYKPDQLAEIAEIFTSGGAAGALVGDRDRAGNLVGLTGISLKPDDDEILTAIPHLDLPNWFREKNRLIRGLPRVQGVVRAALEAWDPDGVIVDEAHGIKNPEAAQTKTLRKLLRDNRRLALLMSGTVTPNDYSEGLELLNAVVPLREYRTRAWQQDMSDATLAKALLRKYMIKRTRAEVSQYQPEVIRERLEIPLGREGQKYLDEYIRALEWADELVYRVVLEGGTMAEAKGKALGQWATARRLLVAAKVADGFIAEAIQETIEGSGSCAVFGVHLDAIEMLHQQLTDLGLAVVKLVGGMSAPAIEKAIGDFQTGNADVFLGSVLVAQGFSLDRTMDTVLTELDYVPGRIGQAESRMMSLTEKDEKTPRGYSVTHCFNAFGLPAHRDMDYIIGNILARKVEGLNELYDTDTSFEATVTATAGKNPESDVLTYLTARAWERAQERVDREGITPPVRKAKATSTKGTGKTRKRGTSEDPPG